MEPGLYIVGTPIGNLKDITLRALETLKGVDAILAEDTRHTRKLVSAHDIHTPLVSCHKFNEASRLDAVLSRITDQGEALALVSDAGMPLVADPGSRLVQACAEKGIHMEVIPGPSSVCAGIAWSGRGTRGFTFAGFLPVKSGGRARRLDELLAGDTDIVLFESPHRILKLIGELKARIPDREVIILREMTKKFEERIEAVPEALEERFTRRPPKGEFVVVIPVD